MRSYRIYITFLKSRKGSTVRKHWTKARLKTSCANAKLCICMFDVKAFFLSPTHFILVDCNTFVSLGMVSLSYSTSLVSSKVDIQDDSGISKVLNSPRQSWLHHHSFTQQPLCTSTQGTVTPVTSGLAAFLSCKGWFHNIFPQSPNLKPEPNVQCCQLLLTGARI